MDNPQDQFGQSNPTDAGRPSPSSASTASGASAASRKSAPMPGAQSTSATPDAQDHSTATAGADRIGEGQQTNGSEGSFLDTALEGGKKWIEDSGALNKVNELPQGLKDFGTRALDRINGLSTTQKVVGGAILAAGIGWLATRKSKSSVGSPYNYGRQRDAGYGRRSYGYQAPDAGTSRRPAAGPGRTDSGSAYANGGNRFGSSNTGVKAGSRTDHGTQSPSSDFDSSTDK